MSESWKNGIGAFAVSGGQNAPAEAKDGVDWNALVDTIRAYNKKCDETWVPEFFWTRVNGINWINVGVPTAAAFYGTMKLTGINSNSFHRAMAGLDRVAAENLKQAMDTARIDDIPRNLRSGFALGNKDLAKAMRDQMITKGLDESLVSQPQRLDVYLDGEIAAINQQITDLNGKKGTNAENMRVELEGRRAALITQRDALNSVPETKRPYIISVVDGEKVKAAVDCGAITKPAGVSKVDDLAKHSKKLALEEKVLESYSSSKKPIKLSEVKKAEAGAYRKYALKFNKKLGTVVNGIPSTFGDLWKFFKKNKVVACAMVGGTVLLGINNKDGLVRALDFTAGDETSETSVVQISENELEQIITKLQAQKGLAKPLSKDEYKKFRENVTGKIDVDSEEYSKVTEKVGEALKEGATAFVSDKGLIDALQSVSTGGGTTEQNLLLGQNRSRNA